MKQVFTRFLPLAGSCLALLVATSPRALAQTTLDPVQQEWVATDGFDSFSSQITALKVAADAAGNAYALSQARTGKNSTTRAASLSVNIKYSLGGESLWRNTYSSGSPSGSNAADLNVDAAGNVYVTGTSSAPATFRLVYTTVNYSTAGYQQ